MNIKNIFLTTIIGSMMTMPTMAQRKAATINDNWEFKLPTSQKWKSVNIPHTYTLDAYQGRNYYKGKAEYRRILTLAEINPDRRYFLKIDAANKAAEVKVNGKEVGCHAGGYSSFTFDITDFLNTNPARQGEKSENTIEITVDNSRQDSLLSWQISHSGAASIVTSGSFLHPIFISTCSTWEVTASSFLLLL